MDSFNRYWYWYWYWTEWSPLFLTTLMVKVIQRKDRGDSLSEDL